MISSDSLPTSIVTKITGVADGNNSVSTMRHDAVSADRNGRLLLNKFLEEQATLGNLEATANIAKQVADFARTDVFGKLKFCTKKCRKPVQGTWQSTY